jgi:hypothetical protein
MSQSSTAFAADLLKFILNSTDLTNNSASLHDGTALDLMTTPNAVQTLYLSLHTAYPGAGGSQTTSEVTVGQYQFYTRKAVSRGTPAANGTEWGLVSALASNLNTITWDNTPGSGSGGTTATHIGVGRDASGAGALLASFPLVSSGAAFKVAYCTTVSASHVFTCVGHGYINSTPLQGYGLYVGLGNSPPTGVTQGTTYYVENLSANTFRLHTLSGLGSELSVSSLGGLLVIQAAPLVIASGFTPTIQVGDFDIQAV